MESNDDLDTWLMELWLAANAMLATNKILQIPASEQEMDRLRAALERTKQQCLKY